MPVIMSRHLFDIAAAATLTAYPIHPEDACLRYLPREVWEAMGKKLEERRGFDVSDPVVLDLTPEERNAFEAMFVVMSELDLRISGEDHEAIVSLIQKEG